MSQSPHGPHRLDAQQREEEASRDDATLQRVLRLVGPRPEVPAAAEAAARVAAEAAWEQTVRHHRQRARFRHAGVWLAAALVLVAIGLVFRARITPPPAASGPTIARVEVVAGPVQLTVDDHAQPLAAGAAVPAGAVIDSGSEGADEGGRGAVRLASGASLRLAPRSRVRLASARDLELLAGALYVDAEGAATVAVHTPHGVVTDIGTQFEVRLLAGEGSESVERIRVREGAILLQAQGERHEARAGSELRLTPDGTVERGTVAIHGSEWDWVLATAPAFDIEGESLRRFLDWLCHEGGWALHFAADDLAVQAEEIVLSGDAEGLLPREAADMVLAGSGLDYGLEDGVLTVRERVP